MASPANIGTAETTINGSRPLIKKISFLVHDIIIFLMNTKYLNSAKTVSIATQNVINVKPFKLLLCSFEYQ